MFVISYRNHFCCGGYGDRIVGLMSIKLMSKLLKRNFYVEWSVKDKKKYIDYSKYDFEKISTDSKDVKTYGYIDLN